MATEALALEHAPTFLADLALVLVGAGIAGVLFRRLGQPAVLGYLLAGVVVGPYLPVPLFADPHRVEALAEFGVVLVMLSIGLEFSIRRLFQILPGIGVPALIQMSTLAWLGIMVGRLLGWESLECIFLGACLAISSTMVVARVVEDQAVPKSSREFAFGILVAQDLVAILAIAGLTAVVSGGGSTDVLSNTAGELLLFLLGLLVLGLLVVPRSIRVIVRLASTEILVVGVAGLAFGLSLLADEMGYSVALGAFLAGALIAESGEGHRIGTLVAPVRDLFAAVFFVAIGMAVDPQAALEVLPVSLLLVAVILIGQLLSVGLGGVLSGRGLVPSLRTGATLGQIGEFSFIIAALGVSAGAIRSEFTSIVVVAALITTFTTPLVVRASEKLAAQIDRLLPHRVRRLLTLYPSWLDELTLQARELKRRSRWRQFVFALGLDVVVLIALTFLIAGYHRSFATAISQQFGLDLLLSVGLILTGGLLLGLPFVVGLVRTGRRLGRDLGELALPTREGVDLAQAPRQALVVVVEIALALGVAILYVTATQPAFPAGFGVVVLAVTIVATAVAFWRTTGELDGHVRAGAQAVAEALLHKRGDRGLHVVDDLLPGLGELTEFEIPPGSPAESRTLSELDLRGRTGATVLAVRRGDDTHPLPGATWRLTAGDLLGLTGSSSAVQLAIELLATPTTALDSGQEDVRPDPAGDP